VSISTQFEHFKASPKKFLDRVLILALQKRQNLSRFTDNKRLTHLKFLDRFLMLDRITLHGDEKPATTRTDPEHFSLSDVSACRTPPNESASLRTARPPFTLAAASGDTTYHPHPI
jgi:hypothetical protein